MWDWSSDKRRSMASEFWAKESEFRLTPSGRSPIEKCFVWRRWIGLAIIHGAELTVQEAEAAFLTKVLSISLCFPFSAVKQIRIRSKPVHTPELQEFIEYSASLIVYLLRWLCV